MQLFEDNKYPILYYSGPNMYPPTTTLAFTQEEARGKEAEGWLIRPIHREYPKHVKTGETKKVVSPWDGETSLVELTEIAHNEKDEKAILMRSAKTEPEKRGPGRPSKVEELATA